MRKKNNSKYSNRAVIAVGLLPLLITVVLTIYRSFYIVFVTTEYIIHTICIIACVFAIVVLFSLKSI